MYGSVGMGRKERDKGLRGERQLVQRLRKRGFVAYRQPLSGAIENYPEDVAIPEIFGDLAVEVKNREDNPIRLWNWVRPASALVLKRRRKPFLIIMELDKFLDLWEKKCRDFHPNKSGFVN